MGLFILLVLMSAIGMVNAQNEDSTSVQTERGAPADTFPELTEALDILTRLEAAMDSILHYESRMKGKNDEELQLLRVQAKKHVDTIRDLAPRLLDLIPKLANTDAPVDSIKQVFGEYLKDEINIHVRSLRAREDEIDDLRALRATIPPEGLGDLEARIDEARTRMDGVLGGAVTTLTTADSLGLQTEKVWQSLDRFLRGRTETLIGRLQIAVDAKGKLAQKVDDDERAGAPESEIAANRIRLRYAERRVEGIASSLGATVDLLAKRGFDTTEYRKFVIQTTGEVTEDVLNPRILVGLVRDFAKDVWQWFKDNAPAAMTKILIVVAFVLIFRYGLRLVWWLLRVVRFVRLSRLTSDLVDGLVRPTGTLIGLVAGLWFLDVNPATLLAGIGVAGIIVGLALQDSLSNLAAGFFILVTKPYDVDDVIQTGSVLGTVRAMGLANTTVRTFDGRRLMVPNRKIWADVIENRSAEAVRRVEITVRVGYADDVDKAIEILRDLLDGEERALKSPAPDIFVSDLADSWIEIAVRPWVKNQDWWPLLTDLPRLVRLRFAKEGIDIPYPRREIAAPVAPVVPPHARPTDPKKTDDTASE